MSFDLGQILPALHLSNHPANRHTEGESSAIIYSPNRRRKFAKLVLLFSAVASALDDAVAESQRAKVLPELKSPTSPCLM
jgi:hypothetical protein